jgi:cation:H+ antiporter
LNAFVAQFHTVIVVIFFIGALFLLSKATDQLIEQAVALSLKLGLSQMLVGATILSLGTTLPEVSSSVVAAIQGNPQFGLGNAIGSIITNTALVLGLGTLAGTMPVKKESRSKLIVFILVSVAFILGSIPGGSFLVEGFLPRWSGVAFLLFLPCYILYLIKKEPEAMVEEVAIEEEPKKAKEEDEKSTGTRLILLIISSAIVSFSAALLVATAEVGAARFGVPDVIIASTIVAFGTSVPEVSTTLVAARYGHGELAIGNVLGANVMNILLVMGATLSLSSEGLLIPGSYYYVQFPALLLLLGLFSYFVFHPKKQAIRRREGIMLMSIYFVYLIVNFLFI